MMKKIALLLALTIITAYTTNISFAAPSKAAKQRSVSVNPVVWTAPALLARCSTHPISYGTIHPTPNSLRMLWASVICRHLTWVIATCLLPNQLPLLGTSHTSLETVIDLSLVGAARQWLHRKESPAPSPGCSAGYPYFTFFFENFALFSSVLPVSIPSSSEYPQRLPSPQTSL